MLAKLETKSNRVKGLSFHPNRPWILASLHNGVIQLWDYRIRSLIERFDEHDGPVRGVCFHTSQPLFVSGGDDYKIKVWNYKQRRCLFTLLGHLDYIRTVQFHHEYPWILSASDDQTIRIWNWQSRNCIAVLTGHNHYVMCATFHPKEDLVVSASLDQTVRVWDVSGLRKKTVSPGIGMPHHPPSHHHDDGLRLPQNELFGNTDAIVKYVLEGHDRGVNWAAFHPTSPLIVSGADDRQVKLWRMNDTKAWEVDTFRGHFNNVSCVLFHPRQELVISNSEDKTIRVWDIQKRTGIQTFRREHDRFWILAAHPEMNLFAAGHDSGMIVFKLERERPPYVAFQNELLFYVKDKYIRTCELSSSRDVPIISIRNKSSSSSGGAAAGGRIKSLQYSPQDKAVLLTAEGDGGHYELYQIPKDVKGGDAGVDCKRGLGVSAVFFGRQRFAVLDKSHQIIIKNLQNEETKRFPSPYPIDMLFAAPVGMLLLRSEEKITLFDVQQRKSLAELTAAEVKFAFWSLDQQQDQAKVALVGKDTIIIANRKLEQLCTVHETIRIKSGAWDENGIFIYSTLNHIKYCLPNGDNGIVRTLDAPLYITAVRGNRVYCLDRESKNRVISIDNTEYMFKYALIQRKYSQVLKMVKEYNLIGQAIISYLQKKGFPEVALYFVKDEKTRFNLALECGNIEVAWESAKVLDDKDCWHKLGVEALRQGNHQIVEMAYQRTKNFERLSFLYLITGNIDKLKKMLKISEMRGDIMSRFHNALYLGDIQERLKILEQVGQLPLAYLTAQTHGLTEEAAALAAKLTKDNPDYVLPTAPSSEAAHLFVPAVPVLRLHETNWPLLNVSKGYFDGPTAEREDDKKFAASGLGIGAGDEEISNASEWESMNLGGDEEDILGGEEDVLGGGKASKGEDEGATEKSEWDVDLDLGEIKDVDVTPTGGKGGKGGAAGDKAFVVLPHAGPTLAQIWCNNSLLAADHAAAGAFDSAMKLLNQQVGVVNFAPLKEYFLGLFSGSRVSLQGVACVPSITSGLQRNATTLDNPRAGLPALTTSLQYIIDNSLKNSYKATTNGKFSEALSLFTGVLHSLLFVVVESKKEANEVKELLGICREYITGLRLELSRRDLAAAGNTNETAVRQTELACYFTHCNLQQIHLMLSLRSAMTCSYKIKNYQTAANFARRLLELDPANDVATQARKVVKFAEQNNENAHNLNYNERNPFVVCGISFTPIYKGSPLVHCPLCAASFQPAHRGKVCPTCQVAQIGLEVQGLQLFNAPTAAPGRGRGAAEDNRKKKAAPVVEDDWGDDDDM